MLDITRARFFQRMIAAAGLAGILVSGGSAHSAGKPTQPPPINPAIVYVTSGGSGSGHIAVANADGTNQKVVFSNAGVDATPSWSPDGKQIVFASNTINSGPGIYVLSIDRATAQAVGTPQKIAPLIHSYLGHAKPVWSPVPVSVSSGSNRYFVAYTDTTSPNGSDSSIHLVDPSAPGSQFKLRNFQASTPAFYYFGMTWSPDATRLAVSSRILDSQVASSDVQIVTLQAVGCPLGELVCEVPDRQSLVQDVLGSPLMTANNIMNPDWGNTGAEIAVSARIPPNDNSDIWAIPVLNPLDARNVTNTNKVTPPDTHEILPTWSPNDLHIAYRAGYGNGCNGKDKNAWGIWVRNMDGSNFLDGCKEKLLIKEGDFPNWWRGLPQP